MYVCVCVCVSLSLCMHVCMCLYVLMNVCVCVCVCVWKYEDTCKTRMCTTLHMPDVLEFSVRDITPGIAVLDPLEFVSR